MNRLGKQRFIRRKSLENRYDPEGARVYWSRHAIDEMINDGLSRSEIEKARQNVKSSKITRPGIVLCQIAWFWPFCRKFGRSTR